MTDIPILELPRSLNYIGCFLTMDCNLNCSYCINDPVQAGDRNAVFKQNHKVLRPELWTQMLKRIPFRVDLPITLQGGEPMVYWQGRGVGEIIAGVDHYFDLLTNFALPATRFGESLGQHAHRFQRGTMSSLPYQSIRVSWHPNEMNRVWKRGIDELVARCEGLREFGFRVSADKAHTDVCIYMVGHPDNEAPQINGDVYFEVKPFLGVHDGKLYGEYAYPHSTDLIARGINPSTLGCECRTTELLIDPIGDVWDCHFHLYDHWLGNQRYKPIGNMLDPDFSLLDLEKFHACSDYGRCVGCDTKVKNNRFQALHYTGKPHTSVEIRTIQWPKGLP